MVMGALAAVLVLTTGTARSAADTPSRLKKRLLFNYGDRTIRPAEAAFEANLMGESVSCGQVAAVPPEEISVQFYVDQFMPLNEVSQTFGLNGYLRAYWMDTRLAYNSSDEGGCTDELSLSTFEERALIWKPEF
jgi:hypothetical protein